MENRGFRYLLTCLVGLMNFQEVAFDPQIKEILKKHIL